MSCRPAHAPPGRGTLLASLWDVTWVREMLGLVEAACWMWSRSVFLWPSRNPKPLPGTLPGGRKGQGMCWSIHLCWSVLGYRTPGLLLLRQGQKQLLPLARALVSPSVQNQEEIFFPRDAQQEVVCCWGKAQEWQSWGLPTCVPHCGVAAKVEMLLQPPGSRAAPCSAPLAPT